MDKQGLHVLLRGDGRWLPILAEELAEFGVLAEPLVGVRESLRRLDLGPLWRRGRADILHLVYVRSWPDSMQRWARRKGKKVVAHWIGSDVTELRRHVQAAGRAPEHLLRDVDVHLADSPQLGEELASMGIASTVVRLLPRRLEADVLPLPQMPAVLSYWQDFRPQFYNAPMVMELARRFVDMRFYIVGATGKGVSSPPPNVEFLGNVKDMEPVYARTTALIRILEHDSLSAMVLEAMARGRYVLYSEPFPHTFEARTLDEASACLERLRSQRQPNDPGARYVRENFSWRNELRRLMEIYETLLKGQT